MRVARPSRRSCNSAQMRELERKVSGRTDLRLQPKKLDGWTRNLNLVTASQDD
jgi:hypothetical protein